jgi:hypothetical protein
MSKATPCRDAGRAREPVDVIHRERHFAFLRGRQQVQNRVGRPAHRDVERMAFSNASKLAMRAAAPTRRRPLVVAPRQIDNAAGPPRNSFARSACVATSVPFPGSASPSASVRQFIELAVNMPEHDPQVGHAERSMLVHILIAIRCCGGHNHRVDVRSTLTP